MALFVRKQDNENFLIKTTREIPLTSEGPGGGFIKLIVGLGNIGQEYTDTRHNVGFAVIDAFAKKNSFPKWQEKTKFKALISEDFLAGQKVILAKPTTLMNLSGEAVTAIKTFYKLTNNDIVVVHDELDLPFGSVKEKQGGGSAGNNGLKSIISLVGEDFRRVRVGIKNDMLEKMTAADFVLAKFSTSEKKQLANIVTATLSKL